MKESDSHVLKRHPAIPELRNQWLKGGTCLPLAPHPAKLGRGGGAKFIRRPVKLGQKQQAPPALAKRGRY